MCKICVIGHFGFANNLLNGQTIKTKNVTKALIDEYGLENVKRIDTHGGILKLPFILFSVFIASFRVQNIIMLPGQKGLLIFAPLLSFFTRITKCRMHYIVIGGWLSSFLKKHKWLITVLNSFQGIYIETNSMKCDCESIGLKNVFVLPNFKFIDILDKTEILNKTTEPYRVCTFSRVMKEKGIEDAIDAIKNVNKYFGKIVYELDIYGPIDDSYIKNFNILRNQFPNYIRYCGTVDSNKTTEIVKQYYMLLFPTYYQGEGFAGTIIDAFSAGVAVIATDWKYNREIVKDGYNGFIYSVHDISQLVEILKCIVNKTLSIDNIKNNCLTTAQEFLPNKCIKVLLENIK